MAKPRKKASAPEPAQPRIPVIGERVRRPGSDTEFEITFVSIDYRQVHIGIPRTNFEYRNVEASTLTYLEQRETRPAKSYVDVDPVMEHIDSVQRPAHSPPQSRDRASRAEEVPESEARPCRSCRGTRYDPLAATRSLG